MLYLQRNGQICNFSCQYENKCLWGKKGNTNVWSQQWVKGWVTFARQFVRPRWSWFHGVCWRHGRKCQPRWYQAKGKSVLCSRWGELLQSCPHPERAPSTQDPFHNVMFSHILCSCMCWWRGQTWSLHRCSKKYHAWDHGLGKFTLHLFDRLCDSSNLHPVP